MNSETNKTRVIAEEKDILKAASNDPLVGKTLGDHLQIISCVGSGGMSVVYKAHDFLLNRIVAVKILHPHSAVNPQNVLRFRQEAMAASKINHPNVISIYEFAIPENGQPYLVMDYLEGQSLAEFISANGPVEMQRAISLMSIICDGLQRAHDVGVVHRDIKPGNIMLVKDADGKQTLKIVDFGIAKILTENENGHELTQTGEVFGSPLYMSPEQCYGKQLDERSDLYSLGCVMYEMCTKQPPIKGASLLETIQLQTTAMPPHAKTHFPGIRYGDAFDQVIEKALAKDPGERYQSASEFKQALQDIPDIEVTPGSRDKKTRIRYGDLAIGLVAAALCLIGLSYALQQKTNSEAKKSTTAVTPQTVAAPAPGANGNNPAAAPSLGLRPRCPIRLVNEKLVNDKLRTLVSGPLRNAVTDLYLTNSPVTDDTVKLIEQLNLVYLDLSDTAVTNKCVTSINTQKNLDTLLIERTLIDDNFIEQLAPLNHLTVLNLAHTKVTSAAAQYMTKFHRLRDLGLSMTKFDSKGVGELTNLTCKSIRLLGDNLTAQDFQTLATMTWLNELIVGRNPIDAECVRYLSTMTNLSTLNLESTAITDADIEQLGTLKNMQILNLRDCPNITDRSLQLITKNYRGLKRLTLKGNLKITLEGLKEFRESNPGCDIIGKLEDALYRMERRKAIEEQEAKNHAQAK